jgi:hypothetical protein
LRRKSGRHWSKFPVILLIQIRILSKLNQLHNLWRWLLQGDLAMHDGTLVNMQAVVTGVP